MTTSAAQPSPAALHDAWGCRETDPARAQRIIDAPSGSEVGVGPPHLIVRAFLLKKRGEVQEALAYALDAVIQLAGSPPTVWDGRASNTLALVYSGLGLPESAVEFFLAGQQQSQRSGDGDTAFSCFHEMGVELVHLGDFDGAMENFQKAEALSASGRHGLALLTLSRCDLFLERGDLTDAVASIRQNSHRWNALTDQLRLRSLLLQARVWLATGDGTMAQDALEAIRALFDTATTGPELPMLEARLCLLQGDLHGAEVVLRTHGLNQTSHGVEDVHLAGRLVQVQSEIAETRGDYQRALEILRTDRCAQRRRSSSRVTTLILNENHRQLQEKSRELESRNSELNQALERLEELNARVRQLALRDHLTGLHNRRYLSEHVGDVIRQHQRYGRDLSLLVLDVDDFKMINDTHLHSTGDAVLQKIAGLLLLHTRAADVVCRVGGDEFVALLPETDLAGARSMADRIRNAIVAYSWSDLADGLNVGVSIGVASGRMGSTLEDLMITADVAMYSAKSAGKNQVHISA